MLTQRENNLLNELLIESCDIETRYMECRWAIMNMYERRDVTRQEAISMMKNVVRHYSNRLKKLKANKVAITARIERRTGKLVA